MKRVMTLNVLNSTIKATVIRSGVGPISKVESTLIEDQCPGSESIRDLEKRACLRAILDVIQAHAQAGIDVSERAYVQGIESAVLGL